MLKRNFATVLAVTLVAALIIPLMAGGALAGDESWTKIGSGGLAPGYSPIQTSIEALCAYNGALYAGTSGDDGGRVWRYNGSSWSCVSEPGFGDNENRSVNAMTVLGSNLYTGTHNSSGSQVWRYNGSNWAKVSSSSDIEKSKNQSVESMAVRSGQLYVGTYNSVDGCEVWCYSGSAWTAVVGGGAAVLNGFGSAANMQAKTMAVSSTNVLYVGTTNGTTGCQVYSYDGAVWTKANNDGFGDGNNTGIYTSCFYNNQLYACTQNYSTGSEVWRYDGPGPSNWTQVNADGFGDANSVRSECSTVFGSTPMLYVGVTNESSGCKVMRYNGSSWSQANTNGFGDPTNCWFDSMVAHNSKLYSGIPGEFGVAVYCTTGGSMPHAWVPASTTGFTDNANQDILATVFYNGQLYAGTENWKGCRMYSYDGSTWKQVGSDGLGNPYNSKINCFTVADGRLYVGTYNWKTGGEVWSYDGATLSQINTGGFGDAEAQVNALTVFNSKLYAGTESYSGLAKVYRYDGPNASNWTQVNQNGFGSTKHIGVNCFAVHNSKLYAATYSSNDPCGVYRWDGSTPSSWTQVNQNGFGDASNAGVNGMASYNGKLHASVWNRSMSGARVYRWDGSSASNWTKINNDGWGEADTKWCYQVQVFSDMLYVGACNGNTGAQVWRYDGTDWKKVGNAGFGESGNHICSSLTTDGSSLYAGTENMTGGAQVLKTGSPGNVWYLAEGTSAWGFSTYVTIENQGSSDAHAEVTYMTSAGPVDGGIVGLPARSQTTINPKDTVGEVDFSTKVQCLENSQIAVDRTMYWDFGAGMEAHSSVAVNNPAAAWFLPEGSSEWGFETWLLIQNPSSSEATCRVTYMVEGEGPQVFEKKVAANSRASYNMADDIGAKDASIKVEADMLVIPERAMYRNSRREGHDSIGTTAATTDFYLAEGTSAWGFTTYVLVQNPNPAPCDVTLTYMTNNGPVPQAPLNMPANSRKTVRVNDVLPNTDFSTHVEGTLPIIAERAMYWDNGTGEACHDSIGMSEAHKSFYLPDGQTTDGRETWTLVQNPNNTEVKVEITYMTPDGSGNQTFTAGVPANSRMTYNMADAGINGRAATYVTCKTAGKKIMVERAMYWNSRGVGTDTIGGYSD